jgi:hypothetical protein
MDTIDLYKDCIYNKFTNTKVALPPQTNRESFIEMLKKFLTTNNKDRELIVGDFINLLPTNDWYVCNLKSLRKLGDGENGMVFKLDENRVIKFPYVQIKKNKNDETISAKPGCLSNSKNDRSIITNYIEEQITSILMYCLEEKIKESFAMYIQCFPKIFSIQKLVVKNTLKYNVGTVSEELVSLFKISDPREIVEIIIQVANNLYILQKFCEFMHRDFHMGNVMLQRNSEPKTITLYNGFELKNQNYNVIFIDFANACARIDDLTICTDSINMYGECQDDDIYEFLRDYDLRLFLVSLYNLEMEEIDQILDTFFEVDKFKKFEKEFPFDERFHSYYEATLDRDDEEFYPENVMKVLLSTL